MKQKPLDHYKSHMNQTRGITIIRSLNNESKKTIDQESVTGNSRFKESPQRSKPCYPQKRQFAQTSPDKQRITTWNED